MKMLKFIMFGLYSEVLGNDPWVGDAMGQWVMQWWLQLVHADMATSWRMVLNLCIVTGS